ncbi:hypothetical protein [Nonomuraea aurantiaca]|nr:hypothetical protein [Nonomuraea aurantiaca]
MTAEDATLKVVPQEKKPRRRLRRIIIVTVPVLLVALVGGAFGLA